MALSEVHGFHTNCSRNSGLWSRGGLVRLVTTLRPSKGGGRPAVSSGALDIANISPISYIKISYGDRDDRRPEDTNEDGHQCRSRFVGSADAVARSKRRVGDNRRSTGEDSDRHDAGVDRGRE